MPSTIRILVVLCLLILCCDANEAKNSDEDQSPIDLVLYLLFTENKYDKRNAPHSLAGAAKTLVKCDLYVNSFDSISESNMDFAMNLILFLEWNDPRLMWAAKIANPFIEIDSNSINQVWLPDLYFPNEKEGHFHTLTVPNQMMRIYSNGNVLYATRLSLTLTCPMDLRKYPLDQQSCAIRLQSYAYSETQLQLEWGNSVKVPYDVNIKMPHFEIDTHTYSTSCISQAVHQKTGNRSCLEVEFKLVRNLGYYLVQIYVPSVLIVMLSWLSFWLNVESVPARISLGVLTVLTMTTQASATGAALPRVSYTKAIDVWMVACLVFVFSALIEFSVANVFARKENLKGLFSKKYLEHPDDIENHSFKQSISRIKNKGTSTKVALPSSPSKVKKRKHGQHYAHRLDMASRILFPMAFGLFNLLYWLLYNYGL